VRQPTPVLIDDSAPVREVLRLVLGAEGYHVIEAADGRGGVALFREHRPTSAEAMRHLARDSIRNGSRSTRCRGKVQWYMEACDVHAMRGRWVHG
jgi:CheY-like chemotaxis protein